MADLISNPIVGNLLGAVAIGGTVASYATLSRRIKRLEKLIIAHGVTPSEAIAASGLSTVALSSGATHSGRGIADSVTSIDLVARIEQLEAQNDLLIKKINSHEMFLAHVGHELKARAASNYQLQAQHHASPSTQVASSPMDYRQRQRILTPSVPIGGEKEDSESESDESSEETDSESDVTESEDDDTARAAAREFLNAKH